MVILLVAIAAIAGIGLGFIFGVHATDSLVIKLTGKTLSQLLNANRIRS